MAAAHPLRLRSSLVSDPLGQLAAASPETRLPFAAMLMPREHLDLGDLSDGMAAELGVLTVRVVRAVEVPVETVVSIP